MTISGELEGMTVIYGVFDWGLWCRAHYRLLC